MAFLYLIVACWIRLCILIFPSPQGTTTRVLPKHTVTFIFARYSQRLHREAREVLNSSGKISKRRQHCIHTGKKQDKSSCCAPQVGLDHLFGVCARLGVCQSRAKCPWVGLHTHTRSSSALWDSHWLTALSMCIYTSICFRLMITSRLFQ